MTTAALDLLPPMARSVFCNRTLNLRSIRAVGFDMDYTLVHYRTDVWEERAFERARDALAERGFLVRGLKFDKSLTSLGLVLDLERGNLVKANRFGWVTRAQHGTRPLQFEEQRAAYGQTQVDPDEPRWAFVNTLFALSETSLFAQLVDLLDSGQLPVGLGYADLYRIVRRTVDLVHMEGALKQEIVADPDRFVELDAELPLALLDLKHAGKKLLLITNSEWGYSRAMMSYALDRFLPSGTTWRELFDVIIVSARKPEFFTRENPLFRIVDEQGRLEPWHGELSEGEAYFGGHAAQVERDLGLRGDELLYVGDHIISDVHVSKHVHRWRTGLVLRAMEEELAAVESFRPRQAELSALMDRKVLVEHRFSQRRLALQRLEKGYGPPCDVPAEQLRAEMAAERQELEELDQRIAPLARQSGELLHSSWGPLMRAGNDKSWLARQIESYADIYMSRASNLLHQTPFVYARAPRGSLPHDHPAPSGSPDGT